MNYFVFSLIKCALKINGTYICQLSSKPVKVNLNDTDLVEFFSCEDAFMPLCFILKNPIKSVSVLKNAEGNFIFPLHFRPVPIFYENVFSKKFFTDFAINIYNDCFGKMFIENFLNAKIIPLPFSACVPQVIFAENRHIGLFFEKYNYFYLICTENLEIKISMQSNKVEYNNGKIILKNFLPTLLKHQTTKIFPYPFTSGEIFFEKEKQINCLPYQLKTFAFLECLRIGDDVTDFLTDDFKGKDKLKSFLGNYFFILPCHTQNYEYALIYEREVKFIKFKTVNNKICDLTISD